MGFARCWWPGRAFLIGYGTDWNTAKYFFTLFLYQNSFTSRSGYCAVGKIPLIAKKCLDRLVYYKRVFKTYTWSVVWGVDVGSGRLWTGCATGLWDGLPNLSYDLPADAPTLLQFGRVSWRRGWLYIYYCQWHRWCDACLRHTKSGKTR